MYHNYWTNAEKHCYLDSDIQLMQMKIYSTISKSMYGLSAKYWYSKWHEEFKRGYENMNRDNFLLVHVDNHAILINKSAIISVEPTGKKTMIELMNDTNHFVEESYAEVVRRLFN